MTRAEIFENRREVGRKICKQIRDNGGQLLNVKYFIERPYCDGEKNYKFSMANNLRLMASDNKNICEGDPRWISADEITKNGWKLKENAKPELLEVWAKSSDGEQECFLTEFYNASEVDEKEKFKVENRTLNETIEFFQVRGLLYESDEIISFQDCVDVVKKYAAEKGADELTAIFATQIFVAESKLHTKIETYLPTYSEKILFEIEENPDKLFEAASKARSILKNLRQEKIKPLAEEITSDRNFGELKIIYHGSEGELKNKIGLTYLPETILTGGAAYEFLFSLKSSARQKIWLEFFYQEYAHGKFLISAEDMEMLGDSTVTDFLKSRLDRSRREILSDVQKWKKYISEGKKIQDEEILNQVKIETRNFQSAMTDFEKEEIKYIEGHPELLR